MINLYRVVLYSTLVFCTAILIAAFSVCKPITLPEQSVIRHLVKKETNINLLAVGDISLSRNVAAQIDKHDNPDFPFSSLGDLLLSTDFNFGNLESPFSGSEHYPSTGSIIFNAPPRNIDGLKKYQFKALNLANNHVLDQGIDGLKYTLKYLPENGLYTFGAGLDQPQAWKPLITEIKGIRVAFIGASYSSINDGGVKTNDYVARIQDLEKLNTSIADAKKTADFVIVSMHAGQEYTRQPDKDQTTFAHAAVEYGADLVIGHHPHWIQTIENYQGKYIFYSLGNFIFDQMWSIETTEGLSLLLNLKKQDDQVYLNSITLMPVIIENYSTPRLATPEESKSVLKKINWNADTVIQLGN